MPKIIIHGGAGALEGAHASDPRYRSSLTQIVEASLPVVQRDGARAAVIHAIRLLESDPIFNAGLGSKIQRDKKIRMSASLMDSEDQKKSKR